MRKANPSTTAGWRSPLLHFLVLGALLFAFQRSAGTSSLPEIVISAARIEQLEADYRLDTGSEADGRAREGLIAKETDDELLLARGQELGLHFEGATARRLEELAAFLGQEGEGEERIAWAAAQGLHRRDPEARQRLLEAVVEELTASDSVYGAGDVPPDSELQELLEDQSDRYRTPERFLLTQVFVSKARGDALGGAADLRRRLVAGGQGPEAAEEISDPGPLPVHLEPLSRRGLLLRFGDEVADLAEGLEAGAWSKPVAVVNGAHLFWLRQRQPSRLPALEEIRERLLSDWRHYRREARLELATEELRNRFTVRIEEPRRPEPDDG